LPPVRFPDPRHASPEGIVAVGGDLEVETLVTAYRQGIFPWPVEGLPLLWFSPPERGVLEFAELHVSRSLARARRQTRLRLTLDRAFSAVVAACATTPRPGERGTWITAEIQQAYTRLHRVGIAHSVEAWDADELVGGVYGVCVDGAFAAESMFHRQDNASKLALLHLVDHLAGAGLDWLDIQVLTPHLARLGAKAIDRELFLHKLRGTRARGLRPFDSIVRLPLDRSEKTDMDDRRGEFSPGDGGRLQR
jgi:leucyl/phenylalanyl-tRNA---protein transferase